MGLPGECFERALPAKIRIPCMPVVMSEISTKISISIKDVLINTYRNMYSTTQETYFLLIFLNHSIIFLIPSLSQR